MEWDPELLAKLRELGESRELRELNGELEHVSAALNRGIPLKL